MSQTGQAADNIRLDQLAPGQSAEIQEVAPGSEPYAGANMSGDLNRLMEIGLIPGQSVEMVKAAPLGDPLEIRVMGHSLVLRKADAARILVQPSA